MKKNEILLYLATIYIFVYGITFYYKMEETKKYKRVFDIDGITLIKGKRLDKLKEMEIMQNTLIMFTRIVTTIAASGAVLSLLEIK